MKRYSIRKVTPPRERIPFWKPWGMGRWGGWTLLFLLLLLLFLLLFCLPKRPAPIPPVPPGPDPKDTTEVVPPEPGPDPVPHTGDVQVLLEWDTSDDLDLHVIDPAGEEIYFGHRNSVSGGELDIDANANEDTMMVHPKENVYWPVGGAPKGRYKVRVKWFDKRGHDSSVPYQVTVKYGGQEEHYSGILRIVSWTDNVCTFVLE